MGTTDGALGVVVDPQRRASFFGAELVTNAHDEFHWTFGVAHSRLTTPNSCCGATPTLSYHYSAILPTAGIAYDFPVRRLRFRFRGDAGPILLTQSRSGIPPAGVGPGDPSWQLDWWSLHTAFGGSAHYESRDGWGALAGLRVHHRLSIFGGVSDGQLAPFAGFAWSWPKPPAPASRTRAPLTLPQDTLRLAQSFSHLNPGTWVRIVTRRWRHEGQFQRIDADSVVLITASGEENFALSDITQTWIRRRQLGRSTLIGTAWGGGIAAVVAATATAQQPNCDYCINDPAAAAFIFAIPGAVVGTVVGHIVGWVHRPWRRLYP
jgi:hypothetical protein